MNCKTAKQIRRDLAYHPSTDRKYVSVFTPKVVSQKLADGKEKRVVVQRETVHLAPADPRKAYQLAKKEYLP